MLPMCFNKLVTLASMVGWLAPAVFPIFGAGILGRENQLLPELATDSTCHLFTPGVCFVARNGVLCMVLCTHRYSNHTCSVLSSVEMASFKYSATKLRPRNVSRHAGFSCTAYSLLQSL